MPCVARAAHSSRCSLAAAEPSRPARARGASPPVGLATARTQRHRLRDNRSQCGQRRCGVVRLPLLAVLTLLPQSSPKLAGRWWTCVRRSPRSQAPAGEKQASPLMYDVATMLRSAKLLGVYGLLLSCAC